MLPASLLCPVCSVINININIISKEKNFFVGLENSKAVCVVAGAGHSASVTGGYQLFPFNMLCRMLCFYLEWWFWDTKGRS